MTTEDDKKRPEGEKELPSTPSTPETQAASNEQNIGGITNAIRQEVGADLKPETPVKPAAPKKKYITLEEAAAEIGISPEELTRLREKGEIRAFAEKGQWKFRKDDVAELVSKRAIPADTIDLDEPLTTKKKGDSSFSLNLDSDDSGISLPIGEDSGIIRGDSSGVMPEIPMIDHTPDDHDYSDSDVKLIDNTDESSDDEEVAEEKDDVDDSDEESDLADDEQSSDVFHADDEDFEDTEGAEGFFDPKPEDDVETFEDLKDKGKKAVTIFVENVKKGVRELPGVMLKKSDERATVSGSALGTLASTGLGYASINSVAMGSPVATFVTLPLAGAGNIMVDGVRTARAYVNRARLGEERNDEVNNPILSKYVSKKTDLIDTHEEQAAANITMKLGIIDPKNFPLLPTEEAYAQEVYVRISPIFTDHGMDHCNLTVPQIKKFLGSDLFAAYEKLIGHAGKKDAQPEKNGSHDASHGAHGTETGHGGKAHVHGEGGSHGHGHEEKHEYKHLEPEQVHQVAVQLGRILYTYHMNRNLVGRGVAMAGTLTAGILTGTILPVGIAAGYEAARYGYRRMWRDTQSHLSINRKGELVNTKDGKKELKLPEKAHAAHDEHAKPWKPEKLKELKDEREKAERKVEKLDEQIVAIDEKIQTDTETKAKYDADIIKIQNKKIERKLTEEQQVKLNKLEADKEEWEAKLRNAESDLDDAEKSITKVGNDIQVKTEEVEPRKNQIAALKQQKLPHQDEVDKLQNERADLQQQMSNIRSKNPQTPEDAEALKTATARVAAIDLEIKRVESQIASLDRKIKALNEEIKEIGLEYKEERLEREKKAKKRAGDEVAQATRKIREMNDAIKLLIDQGTSEKSTKSEEAEIDALRQKIVELKLGISEKRKTRLETLKGEAETEFKKLDTEYKKQEGIAEAAGEHHEDGTLKKITKTIIGGKIVETLKAEAMALGGSAVGGAAAAGILTGAANYFLPFSRVLISSPVTGAILGAIAAPVLYYWNRATKAGGKHAPHAPDDHAKKDDHAKDHH